MRQSGEGEGPGVTAPGRACLVLAPHNHLGWGGLLSSCGLPPGAASGGLPKPFRVCALVSPFAATPGRRCATSRAACLHPSAPQAQLLLRVPAAALLGGLSHLTALQLPRRRLPDIEDERVRGGIACLPLRWLPNFSFFFADHGGALEVIEPSSYAISPCPLPPIHSSTPPQVRIFFGPN